MVFLDQCDPGAPRIVNARVQHQIGIGEIIDNKAQVLVKQGQPMFKTDGSPTHRNAFIQRIVVDGRAEQLPIAGAKAGNGGLVQQNLAHRGDDDRFDRPETPLRNRVEGFRAIQFVAKKIETDGIGPGRRIEVHQASPHSVFPRFHHGFGPDVAVFLQSSDQDLARHGRPLFQDDPAPVE